MIDVHCSKPGCTADVVYRCDCVKCVNVQAPDRFRCCVDHRSAVGLVHWNKRAMPPKWTFLGRGFVVDYTEIEASLMHGVADESDAILRAEAHVIVTRFIVRGSDGVVTCMEPGREVNLRTGEILDSRYRYVRDSLVKLGYTVSIETDQPAHLNAERH